MLRSLAHSGAQPCGHEGSVGVGLWQIGGPPETGPSSTQQRSPGAQQLVPQHAIAPQLPPSRSQGVGMQLPPQNGVAPLQTTPQPPQLSGSFAVFTHASLQQ